jgi:hypothetical protein
MPWHIEEDHPGCLGYAVVKDEDGELEGCHRTRAQAEDHLAALNIVEANDIEDEDENDMEDVIDELVDQSARMTNRALVEQILAQVRRPR